MKIKFLAICLSIALVSTNTFAQMAKFISQLPQVKQHPLTISSATDEKVNKLYSLLPPGDSVQFKYEDGETGEYYSLSITGIRFLDLNFDGNQDLLYSGQSGWNNLTNTKVYFNNNGQLKFYGILSGDIIAIDQKKNEYEIFTHWTPCCDSYTSRIEKYIFSKTDSVKLSQSISYIGTTLLSGLPEFDSKKTSIKDLELFASQEDFSGTSPWFKARTRNISDSLKKGHFINMIKLRGNTSVNILNQKEYNGVKWHLVITDTLSDAPTSLYEWSSGKNRRLVGWTNTIR